MNNDLMELPRSEQKVAYQAPELVVLGRLVDLTAAGSGVGSECANNGNNGAKKSKSCRY